MPLIDVSNHIFPEACCKHFERVAKDAGLFRRPARTPGTRVGSTGQTDDRRLLCAARFDEEAAGGATHVLFASGMPFAPVPGICILETIAALDPVELGAADRAAFDHENAVRLLRL
jgi:hypothetical protein